MASAVSWNHRVALLPLLYVCVDCARAASHIKRDVVSDVVLDHADVVDASADIAMVADVVMVTDVPVDVITSADAGPDVRQEPAYDAGAVAAPRPIMPLSTATVTSRRPMLRWALADGTDGAHVTICRDRACASVVAAFDAVGTSAAPAADLPPGVMFWRLQGRITGGVGTAVSPTWEFTVGARTAPVNTSWGATLDVNGDGYADLAVGAPGAGQVEIYHGGANDRFTSSATTLRAPDAPSGRFGNAVASAGDVNGDAPTSTLEARTDSRVHPL
jgi:hypothetical protein